MTKITLFTAALVAAMGFTLSTNNPGKNIPVSNKIFDASVQVTQEEFNNLTMSFHAFDDKNTKGGAFDRDDIEKIIHDLGSEQFIRLRFATDESGYMSLMMKGSHRFPLDDIEYRRNSGSSASFCPANCNMPAYSAEHVSVSFHHTVWENLSASFSQKYPGRCLGGKIDKDAINAVLNSLAPSTNLVNFRYCNDGTNISVIFIGGDNGSGTVMYRNTVFCPTTCD